MRSMTDQVLIAHAEGDEELAEQLAIRIRAAGYEVSHRGTPMIGESLVSEASRVLESGGPVVLCATVQAMGTRWAHRLVNAARQGQRTRVFILQVDEDAYVELLSFGDVVGQYWRDPDKAIAELIKALHKYYPRGDTNGAVPDAPHAELRYMQLVLESCDIIDLANLPETDRHIATRQLELRRLYVALRFRLEIPPGRSAQLNQLEAIERSRSDRHYRDSSSDEDDVGQADSPASIGAFFVKGHRLVILGDPGSGKTTLVRWIATAYLLRMNQHPDWKDLPDVAALPDHSWLPIIIRCRDLDKSDLGASLEDILYRVLRKAGVADGDAKSLQQILPFKLSIGAAILLVDGLDEIVDPVARALFCKRLEQFSIAYPKAPILATSRIVGYREMGSRIGRGFQHLTVAELSSKDKDEFARRWCELTETKDRRASSTAELIQDIHSSDRIERLTSNPMLLTTLALVKRKVGKLPSRRSDLYWNAVEVLLGWRPELDEPLDSYEAIPQLEYLAYAMCDRGVQQINEEDAIELFDRMREEYPKIHAIKSHDSREFLRLLERRTGILVEAGYVRSRGRPMPVVEFRHLSFQEYLAGLALVDGRFPGRDHSNSLAKNVGPLAVRTPEVDAEFSSLVSENWGEALRLCVTSCNDDDVDSVLLAILRPTDSEQGTGRRRAVLAALCLADEPNASDSVVAEVFRAFADHVSRDDGLSPDATELDRAAREVGRSRWSDALCLTLVARVDNTPNGTLGNLAGLCGTVAGGSAPMQEQLRQAWLLDRVKKLAAPDEVAIVAALGIMEQAYSGKVRVIRGLTKGLIDLMERGGAATYAASWALGWLSYGATKWRPSDQQVERIVESSLRLGIGIDTSRNVPEPDDFHDSSVAVARFVSWALVGNEASIDILNKKASDPDRSVRMGTRRLMRAVKAELEEKK
jgi:hypothetical protein